MSFSIIDKNCVSMPLEELIGALESQGIEANRQDDLLTLAEMVPDSGNEAGIYITSATDVAMKRQTNLILKSKAVRQWLIVLVDNGNLNQRERKVAIETFRLKLAGTDKDVLIICGDVKEVAQQLPPAIARLKRLSVNLVLITAAHSGVGRSRLAGILGKRYPDMLFEVCDGASLAEKSEEARYIIVTGKQPEHFMVPAPPDSAHRVTLLCDAADDSPVSYINSDRAKAEVLNAMGKTGWNLSMSFPRFFMFSARYEEFYQEAKTGVCGYEELLRNRSFVMWNQYGLPCLHEEYTSDNIRDFLKAVCVTDRLFSKTEVTDS